MGENFKQKSDLVEFVLQKTHHESNVQKRARRLEGKAEGGTDSPQVCVSVQRRMMNLF